MFSLNQDLELGCLHPAYISIASSKTNETRVSYLMETNMKDLNDNEVIGVLEDGVSVLLLVDGTVRVVQVSREEWGRIMRKISK